MQRRFPSFFQVCVLLLLALQAGQVQAASYVVAPFQVNGPEGYSYLGRAIPPMLTSRLFWQGNFEPAAGQDAAARGEPPRGREAAEALRKAHNADYVVWGSVTVLGQDASLDVSVLDKAGKIWQRAGKSPVNSLIGGLQGMTDAINYDVFGRPMASAPAQAAANRVTTPMNPDFMVNASQPEAVQLNPQIRYQQAETDRLRSQPLNFASRGMAVADLDGDGLNEVLLLDEYQVYATRWEDGRLTQLAAFRLPTTLSPILVRAVKQGGRALAVVSCFDNNSREPVSYILTFVNNQFHQAGKRLQYYLNVASLPPFYLPVIIGQAGDRSHASRGPVFEVVQRGDDFVRGANVANLPDMANVFNFAWMPGGGTSDGDYLAVINPLENLVTFNSKGTRLALSDDRFAGSSTGLQIDRTLPGMGQSSDTSTLSHYYVPVRMIAADLERDGRPELLVTKPISTASTIFANFRQYSKGEVHALQWDGMGMALLWKTRTITGAVMDIDLADVNNDGVLDLAVNVNTYPGSLGTGKIRTTVVLYPLNTGGISAQSRQAENFDD